MKPRFLRETSQEAAPKLLGWILCRKLPGGVVKLRIVEVEAYHQSDPASHSFHGQTIRTKPMFEAGGKLYVYFTYGIHHCLNIVTGSRGIGEGVLIRAGEPLGGIEVMRKNRQTSDMRSLANGPGKLAQALGIFDTQLSGRSLGANTLWLEAPEFPIRASEIISSPRIGISRGADTPWRFFIKDNPFVSRPA